MKDRRLTGAALLSTLPLLIHIVLIMGLLLLRLLSPGFCLSEYELLINSFSREHCFPTPHLICLWQIRKENETHFWPKSTQGERGRQSRSLLVCEAALWDSVSNVCVSLTGKGKTFCEEPKSENDFDWGHCCISRGTKKPSSACHSRPCVTESPQWWHSPRLVSVSSIL